jgi:hypothetical protein
MEVVNSTIIYLNYNYYIIIYIIYLIYHKNVCKCHNVPQHNNKKKHMFWGVCMCTGDKVLFFALTDLDCDPPVLHFLQ